MKLKQKLMAAIVATTTAMPTMATAASGSAFSNADVASLFDQDAQPLQLAALSGQEMKETEGSWGLWGAVIGGIGGFSGYTLNKVISRSKWSWTDAVLTTGGAASAGAVAGPNGVIWGFNAAWAGGTARGVASRYGW